MKKQRIQFALLMAIVMVAMSPQKVWALGGSGTSSSPYTIANASDLAAFASKVNGSEQGAYAKLTADITLTSAWTAMGTSSKPYTGTFDGQGHTISGMKLTATATNAGLFGCVNNATIKNFTLAGNVSSNSDNVGSVVGYAKGSSTIQNIVSNVNITMTAAKSHLGGIAGNIENSTSVLGCTYSGTLNAGSSTDSNGGIVGFANANCSGTIQYCFFNGTVKTTGSGPQMGGILGYTNDESNNFGGVQDCYSCGTLTFAGSDTHVNAIVGRIRARATTTINNTYLSGTATRACNTDGPSIPTSNKAITISVTANNNTCGSVTQSYVNPTSTTATMLHVEAKSNAHYHFTKWSDSGAQTHNVGLTNNVSLKASFAINQYTITVKPSNESNGTVTGSGTYDYNSQQTITATPNHGYVFQGWKNEENNESPRSIKVTGDATYIAVFGLAWYTITLRSDDSNYGSVRGSSGGYYMSEQTIIAEPARGYRFNKWNDGNTNATRKIILTDNVTYTAYFESVNYITVNSNNDDYGTVSGGGEYKPGTVVSLTATPKEHCHFVQWNDRETYASRKIVVQGDAIYTAIFAPDQHTITAVPADANQGDVTGGGTYDYNSQHTITANAKTGYHFLRWSDGDTNASRTVTVTEDKTYTAYFYKYGPRAIYNNGTLTFYNDSIHHEGINYELNTDRINPGWLTHNSLITKVVFDASFASVRPTMCYYWFGWFKNLSSITGLEYLHTESVTDMSQMFLQCQSLQSLDLSGFNTSNVTTMAAMFYGCSSLESLTIDNFDMQNVSQSSSMFDGCTFLNTLTLKSVPFLMNNSFNTQFTGEGKVVNYVLDENSVIYEGTNYLPAATYCNHYHCNGDHCVACGAAKEPKAVYSNGTLTFYYDLVTHEGTTYNLQHETRNNYPGWYSASWKPNYILLSITAVVFDESFSSVRPTTCSNWFCDCRNLQSITGIQYLNTDSVTNMAAMFYNCSSLKSLDLSSFNTSNVTNMSEMFSSCSSLQSLDLSSFNTSNVTTMAAMFYNCSSLESLDLSGFNTSNVTDMSLMFSDCSLLKSLDLSGFNTENVTDMREMFSGCSLLKSLDLSGFNTANVTNMRYMFIDCSSLRSLDLSSFNTSNVTTMAAMFHCCSSLESLDLSGFNTENVTYMEEMFRTCEVLSSLTIGNFDMQKANTNYTFGGCPNLNTLTLKSLPYLSISSNESIPWDCFKAIFSGEGKTVNYELDDNSVVYTGTNYLPAATNATYSRTMPNEWGTIVVPFEIVYNSNNGNYKLYQFEGLEATDVYFREYNDGATIEAGTPMAVKAIGSKNASGKYEVTITGAGEISTVITPTAAVDGLSMNGTYTALEDKNGVYVIDQDKFKYAEASAYVPAFSVWLTGNVPSGAKTLNIVFVDADSDDPASFTVDDVNILANLLITGAWSEEQLSRYDVDKDGKLTIADLVKIISQLNNSTNK